MVDLTHERRAETIVPVIERTGRRPLGRVAVRILTTTDHKVIGHL
jgi:hypothetical protein